MITTLIVDDEIEAREGLAFLLEKESDFKLLDQAKDGNSAIHAIQDLKPDLVFLDIQMPDKNGFEVLESLTSHQLPLIVFVSAYDEYAVEAFRVHALDYIQKPFTDQRFSECLDHVRSQVSNKSFSPEGLKNLMKELQEESRVEQQTKKLKFKSSGKIHFLDLEEIIWIEGFDYYIKIHTSERFHLVRETLGKIKEQLPSDFIRIHKSYIINANYVVSMEPLSRGNHQVDLKNGKQLVFTKFYKDQQDQL